MHVGTDFLKLPPVTGQYWSLFQCSVLGTGGTCVAHWCAAAPNNFLFQDISRLPCPTTSGIKWAAISAKDFLPRSLVDLCVRNEMPECILSKPLEAI